MFHGFGGRLTVSDVGPTTVNNIMALCFKEIGLKKRDLNGHTPFGLQPHHSLTHSLSPTVTLSPCSISSRGEATEDFGG